MTFMPSGCGHSGSELLPTSAFQAGEKLDSAPVNASVVPEDSDRTIRVMFRSTPANGGFQGANADHCRILPRKISASTSRGILNRLFSFSFSPGSGATKMSGRLKPTETAPAIDGTSHALGIAFVSFALSAESDPANAVVPCVMLRFPSLEDEDV
jgi:hypothetical protein